ncbi:MAG: N-acetyltransferase [Flavobacterium sp.]|nr:MAG: N-acetyltransferase [Flavobacterium sp.]
MLSVNFDPFPILESDRLFLRRISTNDVQCVFDLRSDPETMKFVPRPLVKSHADALAHIALIDSKINNNEGINWAITCSGSDAMIGIIGHYVIKKEHFRSEIGYMILPQFCGKGLITEAVDAVLRYGFDQMKLHSVEAIIDPENIASARVLEKNGFVKEAHLRENEFYDGRFLDNVIYSKLNPDDKKRFGNN